MTKKNAILIKISTPSEHDFLIEHTKIIERYEMSIPRK